MTSETSLTNVKTALAKAGGGTGGFLDRLKKNKDIQTDTQTGDPILKMLQVEAGEHAGKWVRGKSKEDSKGNYIHNFVGEHERFVVDVTRAKHGWQAWKDSKPTAVWRPLTDELPNREDLEDLGTDNEGKKIIYKQAYDLPMLALDTDGEAKHRFGGNSMGHQDAVTLLLSDVMSRDPSDPCIFPVVKLADNGWYRAKGYGNKKIFKPGFEIVGWVDHEMNGLDPVQGEARVEDATQAATPANDVVVEPEVVEEESDAEAPPTRRKVTTRRARTKQ